MVRFYFLSSTTLDFTISHSAGKFMLTHGHPWVKPATSGANRFPIGPLAGDHTSTHESFEGILQIQTHRDAVFVGKGIIGQTLAAYQ